MSGTTIKLGGCNFLHHDIIHNKQSHKILTSSDTISQTASIIRARHTIELKEINKTCLGL